MVLRDLFSIGQSGLRASQLGVRTASENVANVNTPGYSRRGLVLRPSRVTSIGALRIGAGVEPIGTSRILDATLDARVRSAGSRSAGSTAQSNVLAQAGVIFGDLEGSGATAALDEFFAALDLLASGPQDAAARSNVLAAASRFTETVNQYATEISSIQEGLTPEIEAQVQSVNRIASSLAELNRQIASESAPSNDLLDRRDQLLVELSEVVDFQVVELDNGGVNLILEGGYALLTDQVVNPLRTTNDNGLVGVEGLEAGVSRDLTGRLRSGSLGGLLRVRDEDLAQSLTELDRFVFDLANEFNLRHRAGFGLDGTGGRDFFVPLSGVEGAARSLSIDPGLDEDGLAAASDPTLVPGDNTNALSLAALRVDPLAGGSASPEALRGVIQSFSDRAFSARDRADGDSLAAEQLSGLRQAISGVSVDEELTTILQFQQSFQAAASIIRTADELTQEIILLKR
ncbi:MAG: flagellar hook-associated protein FlgK [Myxococcota bacterium]